jgi:GTP-binding protein
VRGKQLTNFRVSGKEDAIKITPPIQLTLEYAVEFIADDELVEITPSRSDQEAPMAQAP